MSDPAGELRARWSAFLAKIEARYGEVVDEARETLPQLAVPAAEGGVQPYLLAAQALRSQLLGLGTKIDETWEGAVRPSAIALDPDFEWRLEEERRGTELSERITSESDRLRLELDGLAAERVLGFAEVAGARERRCSECSAALEDTAGLLRAAHVVCAFCSYTNTYEPPTDVRELAWFAVDAAARYRTLASWDALQAAHAVFSAERVPHSEAAIAGLRAAHARHHELYLAARIELFPELAAHLETDRARFARELETFLAPRI